jgi:hypothetical protein
VIDSAAGFVRLRFSDDPEEYRRAASEPAELAVWLDVIENHPEARVWVAHNKTVPLEVLSILAEDPSQEVRFMVSMKRKLTPDILARLAADPDDSVRLQVARHRIAPRAVIEELTHDQWTTVAETATERLKTLG